MVLLDALTPVQEGMYRHQDFVSIFMSKLYSSYQRMQMVDTLVHLVYHHWHMGISFEAFIMYKFTSLAR